MLSPQPLSQQSPRDDRTAELAAWLGLMSLDGVGAAALWKIALEHGAVKEWARRSSPEQHAAVQRSAERHLELGIGWTRYGDPDHPPCAASDPLVPAVLFWRGLPPTVQRPMSVGIVGTRRASRLGLEIASELGAACTRAGLRVVSGLAAGIDAAAHHGALAALERTPSTSAVRSDEPPPTPLAVVGTGLDVVYPARNADLWGQLASAGTICSEYPLGTEPAPWRFPARNRVLVGQCDAVVVVESNDRGGSLITANLAGERGVPVLAVPGSIRSTTASGTNRLLVDGAIPCLGIDDIVTALGLNTLRFDPEAADAPDGAAATLNLSESERAVLDALGWAAGSVDVVLNRLPQLGLSEVLMAVQSLVRQGVVHDRGGMLERVGGE